MRAIRISMLLAGVSGVLFFATGINEIHAMDKAWNIAMSLDIPGKGESNEIFNQNLYTRLTESGTEAHLIRFDWVTPSTHLKGSSSYVAFRDSENRYWAMSAGTRNPVWLHGDKPEKWTAFFRHGYETRITGIESNTQRVTGGRQR